MKQKLSKQVFEYNDYREFLQDLIIEKKSAGGQRFIAEVIRCQPAYFSRIIKGTASISLEQALLLCEYLKLTFVEKEFLLTLVNKDRAGTKELANFWQQKTTDLQKTHCQAKEQQKAPKEQGSYTYKDKKQFISTYRCIRPLYSDPDRFEIYFMQIFWDEQTSCLKFSETRSNHSHTGKVYIPDNIFFLYLLTVEDGAVRLITMTDLELDGTTNLYSAITVTLANPQRNLYIPAAAHLLLEKDWQGDVNKPVIVNKSDKILKPFLPHFQKNDHNVILGI